ncbi:MAG: TlpA disulfide reductase family protein [Candidatus Omnitrophica bacterium]|nr:TlpA disulfide reductase family protein [Candidatus Omnitrophota bacterium]
MRNFRKFRMLLLMALISLALGFGKGALANDIILNDLGGRAVNLSSSKGKPVILFFWTTWCPYCRQEIKVLNQRYAQIEKEGIVIFGVNVSEPDYKVQKFFKGYQLNFKILLDQAGLLADKYNLMGVPTYVFLDKTGQVISQVHSLPNNYKSLLFKNE